MIFIGFQKIRPDAECNSEDKLLGIFSTLLKCGDTCLTTFGCKYFVYGKDKGSKGKCFWEYTSNENCEEGWKADTDYDFYKLGTLFHKKLQ